MPSLVRAVCDAAILIAIAAALWIAYGTYETAKYADAHPSARVP
jgi:hypothetical protein